MPEQNWVRRVVYYEVGNRIVRDFPVKAKKTGRKLNITSEPYAEIAEFVKTVDYKVSVYVQKEKALNDSV